MNKAIAALMGTLALPTSVSQIHNDMNTGDRVNARSRKRRKKRRQIARASKKRNR